MENASFTQSFLFKILNSSEIFHKGKNCRLQIRCISFHGNEIIRLEVVTLHKPVHVFHDVTILDYIDLLRALWSIMIPEQFFYDCHNLLIT